jgi:hypothetical protein
MPEEERKSLRELQEEADRRNGVDDSYEQSVAPTFGFRRRSRWEVHGGRLVSVEQ